MWRGDHQARERERSQEVRSRLEQVFGTLPQDLDYEAKITSGPLDEGILHLAKNLPAQMIVMGTHGPTSAAHKSVTEGIILRAPCPVLATGESYEPESVFGVEGGPQPERLSVLLPFDFTKRSKAALSFGLGLTRRMPHRIHVLHVVEPVTALYAGPAPEIDTQAIVERIEGLIAPDDADRVDIEVLVGNPVELILSRALATKALFILLAAHSKSAFKRLLFGTRTLEILRGSRCPVWFLPPAAQRPLV